MSYEGEYREGSVGKGGRRRDGSALCREGRDGQIWEKEMSQTQWWAGRELREEGEGEILGQQTMMLGRSAHRRWFRMLSPVPIIKLGPSTKPNHGSHPPRRPP